MPPQNLVLILPQGSVIATGLGIEGLARHLSPGSGRYFRARGIFLDLALADGRPDFRYLDEGGWRDARGDTEAALDGVAQGKRTKTALSNSAFECTPLSAFRRAHLVKTGGQVLPMDPFAPMAAFPATECPDGLTPQAIAATLGQPEPRVRGPRIYLVFAPVELLVVSNLSPVEYAWYATRRPGKVFRQCCFTELKGVQQQLAAHGRYEACFREIAEKPAKKTKTVALTDLLNQVPFEQWVGFDRKAEGGLYFADRERLVLSRFPESPPYAWLKAE